MLRSLTAPLRNEGRGVSRGQRVAEREVRPPARRNLPMLRRENIKKGQRIKHDIVNWNITIGSYLVVNELVGELNRLIIRAINRVHKLFLSYETIRNSDALPFVFRTTCYNFKRDHSAGTRFSSALKITRGLQTKKKRVRDFCAGPWRNNACTYTANPYVLLWGSGSCEPVFTLDQLGVCDRCIRPL